MFRRDRSHVEANIVVDIRTHVRLLELTIRPNRSSSRLGEKDIHLMQENVKVYQGEQVLLTECCKRYKPAERHSKSTMTVG